MVKVSPEKTYSFSIKDALNFEGDTAPYIQYTHARACSILRKSKTKETKFNAELLKNQKEKELIKNLMKFPEIVSLASRDFRPHYITNYAFELAAKFNNFYESLPVLKADKNVKAARLALVNAVKQILKNSLMLLGIEAPEKM